MIILPNEQYLKVFNAYLPCKGYDKIGKRLVDMEGYSHDSGMIEFWAMEDDNDCDWGNINNFQLVLTPIEMIIAEDAIEVAKIIDKNTKYGFGEPIYKFDKIEGFEVATSKKFMQPIVRISSKTGNSAGYKLMDFADENMTTYGVIDFLRSKGYNCGYMSYTPQDLYDMGIAVKKD